MAEYTHSRNMRCVTSFDATHQPHRRVRCECSNALPIDGAYTWSLRDDAHCMDWMAKWQWEPLCLAGKGLLLFCRPPWDYYPSVLACTFSGQCFMRCS